MDRWEDGWEYAYVHARVKSGVGLLSPLRSELSSIGS